MSIAALIRAMSEAGAPPEAIAIAVEAIESRENADSERRAKARDKKRRQRAEQRGELPDVDEDGEGTVPGQSRDTTGTVPGHTPFPSPSSSPDPSNNPTHTPVKLPRARKGTRIPDDWQPLALTDADATMVASWPAGTIEREMAKFRDFWAAKAGAGGVKLDWQATWRNWLRQADERIPKNANRTAIGVRERDRDPALALRRAAERAEAEQASTSGCGEGDWRSWSALPAFGKG